MSLRRRWLHLVHSAGTRSARTRSVGPAEKAKASDHRVLQSTPAGNAVNCSAPAPLCVPRSPAASWPRRSRWRRSCCWRRSSRVRPARPGRLRPVLRAPHDRDPGFTGVDAGRPDADGPLRSRRAAPRTHRARPRRIGARLTRGRTAQLVAIGLAAVVASAYQPGTRPAARARARVRCPRANVGTSLLLQLALGLGITVPWTVRYPLQNAWC